MRPTVHFLGQLLYDGWEPTTDPMALNFDNWKHCRLIKIIRNENKYPLVRLPESTCISKNLCLLRTRVFSMRLYMGYVLHHRGDVTYPAVSHLEDLPILNASGHHVFHHVFPTQVQSIGPHRRRSPRNPCWESGYQPIFLFENGKLYSNFQSPVTKQPSLRRIPRFTVMPL